MDSYIAELPTILVNFIGIANTTSTPIGWEGDGQAGSHEMVGIGHINTESSQMVRIIGAIFTFTHHTKQLNP